MRTLSLSLFKLPEPCSKVTYGTEPYIMIAVLKCVNVGLNARLQIP